MAQLPGGDLPADLGKDIAMLLNGDSPAVGAEEEEEEEEEEGSAKKMKKRKHNKKKKKRARKGEGVCGFCGLL